MTETLNFACLQACECMLKNLQRSNECKWKPQCSIVWNKNTQSFAILYIFNQIIYLLNFKLYFFKCCQSSSHRSDNSQNVISNILEITVPQDWASSLCHGMGGVLRPLSCLRIYSQKWMMGNRETGSQWCNPWWGAQLPGNKCSQCSLGHKCAHIHTSHHITSHM